MSFLIFDYHFKPLSFFSVIFDFAILLRKYINEFYYIYLFVNGTESHYLLKFKEELLCLGVTGSNSTW